MTTQAERLTPLTDEQLAGWHREINRVATLTGADALEAVDNLLWSGAQAIEMAQSSGNETEDWEQNLMREQLARVGETIDRLRLALAQPAGLQLWEASTLRRDAEDLGHMVSAGVRQQFATEISAARLAASTLAGEVEAVCYAQAIRGGLEQPIHNASSVQGVITAVDRAAGALTKSGGLTPELGAIARKAKERAAQFRSQKKLEEAAVAAGGGNVKRAEKLKGEAGVMLAQDWSRAFPGEIAPAP
jgi:hypothetical protein